MADQLSQDLASLRIDRTEKPPSAGAGRFVWPVVVLSVLGGVGWYAYGKVESRVFKTEIEVTQIRLVSPAESDVQVTSTGYVVPQRRSKVGARVTGRVTRVWVQEGSLVRAGDPLVRLDDSDLRASVAASRARAAASQARVASAKAALAEPRSQYEREKALAEKGVSIGATVDDLAARLKALEENVNAARADVEAAFADVRALESQLGNHLVTAPMRGVVASKPVEVGEVVNPGGPALVDLVDFDSLVVESDVPESRLALVAVGGPAEIVLDAFPSKRYRGVVEALSPQVNRVKATVVVKVKFQDEPEGVLPEMAARVKFLSKALDTAQLAESSKLFVPASAVAEREGGRVVFTIVDGKARAQKVLLGAPMPGGFELQSGPVDGTRVIANPPAAVSDGYPIKERTK